MKRPIWVGICLIWFAIFMIGNQFGNALAQNCNQFCLEFTHFCETDANKKCIKNKCFFYHYGADITVYAQNCWPCGDGPGKGQCINGDDKKECQPTTEAVNWQFTDSCDPQCKFANSYVQAFGGGMIVGNGNGSRFECKAKKKGS